MDADLTYQEEREFQALVVDTLGEAVRRGQSQSRFRRIDIVAWRIRDALFDQDCTNPFVGLHITRDKLVVAHVVGWIG